ncbi:MAG: hypothetical protein COB38_03165 [Gammaproteobacteria bacterium]|nr:MAG: hypothetical protein COB38_03165 [Gammaproteobacteria bacterium]
MLLRSLTKHVNDQNWFAVFVDFIIVVFGVFVGIQVANWNEAQAFNDRETQLLSELKREIEKGINITNNKGDGYVQVAAAGKRSLVVLSNEGNCETNCWLALVDFMHASQWQDARVNHSIYDEMRRLGLPRNRTIIEKIEGFLAQNEGSALSLDDKPIYRTKIRQLIPAEVQEYYWSNCYTYVRGTETYLLNCSEGLSNAMASELIKSIVNRPYIKLQLTEWTGYVVQIPSDFNQQNAEALEAIALIEDELDRR